jgi:hypothetical protein
VDFNYSAWAETCESNPIMGRTNNEAKVLTFPLGWKLLQLLGGSNGTADITNFQFGQNLGTLILLWADQMMQQNFQLFDLGGILQL